MVYAILGVNDVRYVDKSIKAIEKVPELLTMTGFLKSFFMVSEYKIIFKSIKIRNIPPMPPNKYLKLG